MDSEFPDEDDWEAWYNFTVLHPAIRISEFGRDNNVPNPGQVASLSSLNNFINYCAVVQDYPLIGEAANADDGLCTPAPMGIIPSPDKMPAVRISSPRNNATIPANQPIGVEMAYRNFYYWHTVPPKKAFSAPQYTRFYSDEAFAGHPHLVVEELTSFNQDTPTDPQKATLFMEFYSGTIALIDGGLPPGLYRLTVSVVAANHQPVVLPLVRHGGIGDAIYITVSSDSNSRLPDGATDGQRAKRVPALASRTQHLEGRQRIQLETSYTLANRSIAVAFQEDGLTNFENPIQHHISRSQTSFNNFINDCLPFSRNGTLANGTQQTTSVCNPVPLGVLPARRSTPSSKFVFPYHEVRIRTNTPFDIVLAVNKLAVGQYANPETRFLAAPQQMDERGLVKGYASVVIERTEVRSENMTDTSPTNVPDPAEFLFFHSFNRLARDGRHITRMDGGLPAGYYRITSMLKTANHAPIVTADFEKVDEFFLQFTVADDGIVPELTQSGGTPNVDQNPTTDSETSSSGRLPLAAIIGGGVAGLITLIILLVWAILQCKRNNRKGAGVYEIREPWSLWSRQRKEPEIPRPVSQFIPIDPYILTPMLSTANSGRGSEDSHSDDDVPSPTRPRHQILYSDGQRGVENEIPENESQELGESLTPPHRPREASYESIVAI
ncbi:hypothetical protein AX16_006580 [Volvariella volvacea WC 439]|nr:hypothetical protein AX16_006580 [Volvariella volvacea WC 439]